jgi:aminoglycoside phosphotransferase (APT) family kinase protein
MNRPMIRRIEIDKHGRVCLQFHDRESWCDISRFPPRELDPREDSRIPLAALARKRRLDILGYRPARRMVAAGRLDGVAAVWKGYRRGKGARHARHYALAASALHGGGVRTPAILEVDQEADFLVMRREAGLQPAVAEANAEDFRRMGSGTRQLQAFRGDLDALGGFGRGDELAVLQERVRRLTMAGGSPPEDWLRLESSLAEAVSGPPPAAAVLSHRDLHDGQWLVHEGRPCLLDFDLLCLAEPELDAANFLAHLDLRRLQRPDAISSRDVAACGEAFLNGLGCGDSSGQQARLAFYQATTFARLALVYQLRPRWQGLVGALVDLGLARLANLAGGIG